MHTTRGAAGRAAQVVKLLGALTRSQHLSARISAGSRRNKALNHHKKNKQGRADQPAARRGKNSLTLGQTQRDLTERARTPMGKVTHSVSEAVCVLYTRDADARC